jgi:hypothetical protein
MNYKLIKKNRYVLLWAWINLLLCLSPQFLYAAELNYPFNDPYAGPIEAKEPSFDNRGNTGHKVEHRLNPEHLYNANKTRGLAPTAGSTAQVTPKITYHSPGPVMTNLTNIALVWYGNWNQNNGSDTPGGQAIIRNLIYGLSLDNSYVKLTTSPSQSYKVPKLSSASPVEFFLTETTPNCGSTSCGYYPFGNSLTDAQIKSVVQNAINIKPSIATTNTIYLVLTSSDVDASSGFCSRYCGWHTYSSTFTSLTSVTPIKYAFIGNAARCLSGCAAQSRSPNGNAGVDGMASVIAHELEETVTDPQLNAWFDSRGAENADKCAWTFGSTMQLPDGSYYNVTLGTTNFLLQRALTSNSYCKTAF